jgi:hypothetical protein
MTTQQYLQIENNVVTNAVVWDGGSDWTPPENATMLVQDTTPAMIWKVPTGGTEYVLTEVIGAGSIGFTWNGTVLTTPDPQPAYTLQPQPKTTGTQTA